MKNTVIVQINYSFKGEEFTPSILLEIDKFAQKSDNFAPLYPKIAQENNIDTYSYAYEVMESSPLTFHNPTGNIIDFIDNGKCDLGAYKTYLTQNKMLIKLEKIAADVLGIDNLSASENKALKEALSKAYNAGLNLNP